MRAVQSIACGALFAILAMPGPAWSRPLSTIVQREGKSTKLAVYSSECGEIYQECVLADLGCDSPGGFAASVLGFDGKQAGAILGQQGGKGILTIGKRRIPLQVEKIELYDLNSDWGVALRLDDASKVWSAGEPPVSITLSVGGKSVVFPTAPKDRQAFAELAKRCAYRS